MRSQRIDLIRTYIQKHKTVSLDQLCETFGVSKNTIRRDLDEIVSTGEFKKIYGGVTTVESSGLKPFSERNISNQDDKIQIAKKAAEFVDDDDIIFIDSGTTTFYMIDYLKEKQNLTIFTNNLEVIFRAIPYPNLNVVSLSGSLNRETLSFAGTSAADILSSYNISKAFMASTGISSESGVTNSSPLEHEIKKTAIAKSTSRYLLVDHTKFNVISLLTYSSFDDIDYIITNGLPPEPLLTQLKQAETTILLSQEKV